jgi:hypothetical protein
MEYLEYKPHRNNSNSGPALAANAPNEAGRGDQAGDRQTLFEYLSK